DLARNTRRGGRVVDVDRAAFHRGDRATLAESDGAKIGIVADAAEHDLGALRGFGRRPGDGAAVLLAPLVRLGARAVVDGNRVPFLREPSRHRKTHHAEAEESDVRHFVLPLNQWITVITGWVSDRNGLALPCNQPLTITATAEMNAGIAPARKICRGVQAIPSITPPMSGPTIAPTRPTPSAQPTPVERITVG